MRPSLAPGARRVLHARSRRSHDPRSAASPRNRTGHRCLFAGVGPALGLAFALLLAAPEAQAQQTTGVALREVERGFWVGSRIGAVYYFDLPGEGAASSAGSLMGLEAGIDLGRDVQLGVVAWGQSVGAPADYKGIADDSLDPKRSRGDFQTLMLGGALRYSFLRWQDDNGVDRTFLFARIAGGPTLSRPIGILDEQGFFVSGGLGVEYFTRLRHFSVGLELDAMSLIGDSGNALGVAVLPHLKYTF